MLKSVRRWLWLTCWFSLLAQTSLRAQVYKAGYNLGDVVADFQLNSIDGRTISLADYQTQKGLIVLFISNRCPFSKVYQERIVTLDHKFAPQGYPVLAIVSNDPVAYPEDSFENIKKYVQGQAPSFTYAIDETQKIAHAFGATRTPQVYVLKRINGQFILEYTGTIDDNPQDPTNVERRFVEEAVNSLLSGRPVQTPITKPIGCAIKWK